MKKLFNENKSMKDLINIYYLIVLLITLTVLTSLIFSNNIYGKKSHLVQNNKQKHLSINEQDISNYSYLAKILDSKYNTKEFEIEDIKKTNLIPNITVTELPKEFKDIKSIKHRKELFIKITLPIIIKENNRLISTNREIQNLKNNFGNISRVNAKWLDDLMNDYSSNNIDELLQKVDAIPVSLALAQAVIESGWGTSRFAFEGNALFGQYIWSNGKDGIIPNDRDSNAKFRIKSFDNLSDSVASYMKNLNTNFHYSEFRLTRYVMRANDLTLNGLTLADYLYNYSIEEDYTLKIKNIILSNDFEDFEKLEMMPSFNATTDII